MKQLHILIATITIVFLSGCGLLKDLASNEPPMQRMTMTFDYSPPTEGVSRFNGISFILLNPQFAEDEENITEEPFKTFANNMGKDFEEMMTQRGYTYKGPYDTYDELVYSEKKSSDFILEVEIDYTWQGVSDALYKKAKHNYVTGQSTYYYGFNGDITLGGKVNLTLTEPQTKTKLWVKNIPMPQQTFLLKSEKMYISVNAITFQDVGLYNSVVPPLEKMYDKAMQLAWNHLEPEELKVKQGEADEIRNDAGFKKH